MNSRTKTKRISIFRLSIDNATPNVWGGSWISRWKKIAAKKFPVGESWDFSLHPHKPTLVLAENKKWIPLPKFLKRSPFLLKFIDARDNLSLQVHPDDAFARRFEKDSGKAECWVILSSSSSVNGGYIYLGFNQSLKRRYRNSLTLKKAFLQALETNFPKKKLLRFFNRVKVKPGDVFYLPPGTVHSIGAGVRLFEIQQTSNVTYRVWDWNRVAKRPLHLQHAFHVIRFEPQAIDGFRPAPRPIKIQGEGNFSVQQILMDVKKRFAVQEIDLSKGSYVTQHGQGQFFVLSVIEGEIHIPTWGNVKEGSSVLVMGTSGDFRIIAKSASARIFKSFVPS